MPSLIKTREMKALSLTVIRLSSISFGRLRVLLDAEGNDVCARRMGWATQGPYPWCSGRNRQRGGREAAIAMVE